MENDKYMLQTLERAVSVIEALANEKNGCGVTKLSKKTNINKSTVFKILYTLSQKGYVERVPDSEDYRLGVKILQLGSAILEQMYLRSIAMPYLQQLSFATKETVHLGILDNFEVVYIEKFESVEHSIRMHSQVGKRSPLHCTGMGKILISDFTDEEIREMYFNRSMLKYTNSTITEVEKLVEEIISVREKGIAFDNMEHEESIRCISAPIWDRAGRIIAAISISVPVMFLTEERIPFIVEELKKTSRQISYQMGYNE
ncbi:MAG: IclR family transcriptional regulator [Clostridiales bacterium]|nr:IclR family transcriptional regulator [Clostridiales bacterium]